MSPENAKQELLQYALADLQVSLHLMIEVCRIVKISGFADPNDLVCLIARQAELKRLARQLLMDYVEGDEVLGSQIEMNFLKIELAEILSSRSIRMSS